MMKILKERSLSRFMAHLENGDAILIISGCRNKNSRSLNNLNTESIRMAALKNRFSYNKVKGGYEEDGNVPVFEESSIIYAPKEREEELYEFGKRWGSHCKQEAVFFLYKAIQNCRLNEQIRIIRSPFIKSLKRFGWESSIQDSWVHISLRLKANDSRLQIYLMSMNTLKMMYCRQHAERTTGMIDDIRNCDIYHSFLGKPK